MNSYKHFYWLIVVSFLSQVVFCQDSIESQPRRLSYGINFGAAVNYRFLKSTNSENGLKGERNDNEIFNFGYAFGLQLHYRLTKKFSIDSGLEYNDFGFKTRKQDLYWTDDNSITQSFVSYHYKYITIPVNLKYSFYKNGNWTLFAAGGIAPAIFIQLNKALHYNDGSGWNESIDKQGVGYDRLNYIANLQFGFDYKVSRKFSVSCNMFYKQFLKGTNSKLPTRELLNSAGAAVGISYHPIKKIRQRQ